MLLFSSSIIKNCRRPSSVALLYSIGFLMNGIYVFDLFVIWQPIKLRMWMSGVGTLYAYAHYRASLLIFRGKNMKPLLVNLFVARKLCTVRKQFSCGLNSSQVFLKILSQHTSLIYSSFHEKIAPLSSVCANKLELIFRSFCCFKELVILSSLVVIQHDSYTHY